MELEGGKMRLMRCSGRVLSGKWEFVESEIRRVNEAVVGAGSILKVIFENDCKSFVLKSYWLQCQR